MYCLLVTLYSFVVFFFFSSRRPHTRSLRDWSSDVYSSDLAKVVFGFSVVYTFARERPIDISPAIWPWARRLIQNQKPTSSSNGRPHTNSGPHTDPPWL